MACVKDDFMMKSIPQPADDDVILIQSDDDAESDDVVLVSDGDSNDCPRLPSNHKKPHKKRSRRRRKKFHPLSDLPESAEFLNRSSVSNHLDFSSEVNFCTHSSSVKETTIKPFNDSLYLTDRGESQRVKPLNDEFGNDDFPSRVEHEMYYGASADASISHQGSTHLLPNSESESVLHQNLHVAEMEPSDLPAIVEVEFPDKADVAESTDEVANQDESISRDEMAMLADVDVSLLSNISFCSDLSNDLPSDLPSTLAIDLANDFSSLESGLDMEKAAGSLDCGLSLGPMGNCFQIASYSRHALDTCSSAGNPSSVTYHLDAGNPRISENLSEAENLCNFANVDGNSCNMGLLPCAAEGFCDTVDDIPVMNGNFLSGSNICDLDNVAGNPYTLGNSHSTGNLLEMEILSELGNSLEIDSLNAMDSLQEFQNLPGMGPEEAYLEDKDLEVDLSSTFIKDVLNLNVGEAVSDPLTEPLNFSTIVSAFDSLISSAPQLALSSTLPVTVGQHPLMSSASSVVHNTSLALESSMPFESQHYVFSSEANSVPSVAHSLLSCASSVSAAQSDPLSSSVSFAQLTEESTVPLSHPPLSPDSAATFIVQPQLSSTVHVEQQPLPSSFFSPNLEIGEDAEKVNVAQETDELQLQPILYEQMKDLLMKSDAAVLDDEISSIDDKDKSDADSEDRDVDFLVKETSSDSPCSYIDTRPQPEFVLSDCQMATDRDPSVENSASALHKNLAVSESSFPVPSTSIPLVIDSVSIPSVCSPVNKAFNNEDGNGKEFKMVVGDMSDSLNVCGDTDSRKIYQYSPAKSSFLNNNDGKMSTDSENGVSSIDFSSRAPDADEYVFRTLNNENANLTDSYCPLVTDVEITAKNENYLPSSLTTSSNSAEAIKSIGMLDLKVKEDNIGQCFLNQFKLRKRPRKESAGTADEPVIDLAWKKVRLDEEGVGEDQLLKNEVYDKKEDLEESCDIVADDVDIDDRPEDDVDIDDRPEDDVDIDDRPEDDVDPDDKPEDLNEENDEFEVENQDLNEGFQDVSNVSEDLEETNLCLNEGMHDLTENEECRLDENPDSDKELEEINLLLDESHKEVEDLDEAVLIDDENLNQVEDGIELEGTVMDLDKGQKDQSEERKTSDVGNLDLSEEIEDQSREIEGVNRYDLDMNEASQNISACSYSLKNRNVNTKDQLVHRSANHSYEHSKENFDLNMKNCNVDKENMVIRNRNKSDLDCNYNRVNGRCHRPKALSPPPLPPPPSLPLPPHALGNACSVVGITVNKETVDVLKAKCFNCLMEIAKSVLAYCTAGHGCCSGCLHGQVKAFLATSSKSPFSCQFQGCNSFYLISQLRSSLPKMVVDILEAKLEREYSDSTAQLLKKVNGIHEMNVDTDEEQDDMEPAHHPGTSLPAEICVAKDAFELPLRWKETNENEYQLIDVTANSDEFAEVSELFHRTMLKSRATILRLQRLQNPVLWEFYTVKKKQKEMEGVDKRSFERLLFHGSRREFVDTICLNNFDWRTCGVSHGIMYGQGTYFARDASYAHRYTDRNPNSMKKSCSAPLNVTMTSDDFTPAAQVDDSNISFISPSETLPFDTEAQVSSKSSSDLPVPTNVAADDWERHVHLMFLARVIVGRYTRGKRTYRKPPAIDLFVPYGKCYDSCVNYVDDPTLFVIFDSSQYYPEYLIHYTNCPKVSS